MRFGLIFQSGCIERNGLGSTDTETPVHSGSHASEFPISLCSAKRVDSLVCCFFLFNFFRADVKHNLCGLGWGKSQIMVSSLVFQGHNGGWQGLEEIPGVEEVMPRGQGASLVDLDGRPGLQPLDLDGTQAIPANLQLEKEMHVFKGL